MVNEENGAILYWFLSRGNFCHLLIIFEIIVSPYLEPNHLTLFLKEIFEKVNFERSQQRTTKA